MSPYVPALLAALAVLALAVPPASAARVRALTSGAAPATGPPLLGVAAVLALVSLGPLAAGLLVTAAVGVRAVARRAAAAGVAREHAAAVPGLCRTAAAELRAGAPPAEALTRAADDAPPALAAHLRAVAAAPGAAAGAAGWTGPPGTGRLAAVGALWSVAAGAGAGLADGLDRLADALAAEERQRAEVAAQLAGPRASAAVLAALPAFGLALAAALGAEPLRFLATPAGVACLAAAAGLDAAGVWWVRRLTGRATG